LVFQEIEKTTGIKVSYSDWMVLVSFNPLGTKINLSIWVVANFYVSLGMEIRK